MVEHMVSALWQVQEIANSKKQNFRTKVIQFSLLKKCPGITFKMPLRIGKYNEKAVPELGVWSLGVYSVSQ